MPNEDVLRLMELEVKSLKNPNKIQLSVVSPVPGFNLKYFSHHLPLPNLRPVTRAFCILSIILYTC